MIDALMLKLTAAAVFVLAGTAAGYRQAARLAEREKILEDLIGAMKMYESEIYYTHERLEHVARRLSAACRGKAGSLFENFAGRLALQESRSGEEIWNDAVKDTFGHRSALREDDLETLKSAGIRLGRDDVEGQCGYIEKTARDLGVRLEEARQDKKARSSLFKTLGIAAGCAGAILVF